MDISKAVPDDLDAIIRIVTDCVSDMERHGIFQWSQNYPNRAVIQADIDNGTGFIYRTGEKAAAYFAVDCNQPPQYGQINWSTDGSKVMVVHRLCVLPQLQGRGIACRIMAFVDELAAQNGCTSIRLDAYSENPAALRLYDGRGFKRAGQVYFPTAQAPFWCYEKAALA
jgi:ribosomal protein S18 acetylase RimI-like enzyme